MAITVVLAGLVLTIVGHTLGLWHRVEGDFSQTVQARLVLDFLERDLQSALHRGDTGHWLAIELQNSPTTLRDVHGWLIDAPANGCTKPATSLSLDAVPSAAGAGIARARFALGGTWLRLFSLDDTGLPSAVSYQLVRRAATGQADLANLAAPHYLLFRSTATDVLLRGDDVTAGYDDVLAAPGLPDVLADNVVDFGVWFYARDRSAPDGLRRIFPVGASDTVRFVAPDGNFPEVADVMVRIISDEGAALLGNLESGRGRVQAASDADWWTLVEAHSTVFVQRIELKGAGQ